MEEEEKKKSVASVPDNYVSILQLQERWLKEKERKQKQKESVERGVKQQVDHGQGRREEEDVMKVVESMEARVKPGGKSLGGGSRVHCAVNRCKKEPKCVKKEDTRSVFTSKGGHAAKEETKFQYRWIKKRVEEQAEETREVKGPARLTSEQGYYRSQRHDWSSTRVFRAATRTMMWVKKGNN